jgi:hypothetical protein
MKKNLVFQQGSSYTLEVRWEQKEYTFKPITAITKAAPPVITATSHGVPDNWRVAMTNIRGMTELNAANDPTVVAADFYEVNVLTGNTLELKNVDATGFGTYVSGGILRYYPPVDLTGYTARMDIRQTLTATTTLLSLTTGNGRIAIDTANYVITLDLTAAETEALTFSSAVYSLEMVGPSSDVTQLLYGSVKLDKEVTRP